MRSAVCFFRRLNLTVAALGLLLAGGAAAGAQTAPIAFPSTISTLAGTLGGATAVGAGKLCNGGGTPGPGNTLPVATDAINDGCPATQALLSADLRGGVATDPLGNVYILDGGNGGNNVLRKVDARSGIISLVVGGAVTICANAVDKEGDGCPFANAGGFNNPRGVATDPYGNVIIAGYGDAVVHVLCNVVSPLCSQAQVGTMRVAAGCTTTSAAYGTSGAGADNVSATPNGTCSTAVGELNQPRGATADAFGNVYIADTAAQRFRVALGPLTYNGVTNPLVNILKLYSTYSNPTAGFIYALVGGAQFTTVPTSGAYCTGSSGPKAFDAYGDGCPFFQTKTGTSGTLTGIATDALGNVFMYDYSNTPLIRVMYVAGSAVANAITVNNPTVTAPVVGSVYVIAGGGGTSTGSAPVIGSAANFGSQTYKLTVDQFTGNVYIAYSTNIGLLDMSTGYVRKIAVGGGGNCTSATSATGAAPNSAGDGCPATATTFAGGSGIGMGVDALGNLYLGDYPNALVRKISASTFASAAIGSSYKPNLIAHTSAAAGNTTPAIGASTDFTLAAPTCVANSASDNTVDCTSAVTFTPTGLGLRTAPVTLTPATGTAASIALTATGTGTGLVFDPATASQVHTSTVGQLTPYSVALDGAGNVFTTSNGTKAITEITAGTSTSLYTAASTPTQLAVDPRGNVYGAVGSANILKLSFTAPSTYTASTITNAAISNVKAIAVDANLNVYVADSTNQIVRFSQTNGQALTLTSAALSNPVALALDSFGNLLIADKGAGAILKIPASGIIATTPTTVLSGISPVGVSSDPAGNIYYVDSSSNAVVMIPVSGANTTVLTGLNSPNGLAVDGIGNVYVSDLGGSGITIVNRSQYSYSFPDTSTVLSGTLTNIGNVAATGFAQTDSSDFQLAGSGATCNPAATSILPGSACTIAATFTPSGVGGGTLTNTLTLKPAASALGALVLSGTVAGNAVTTSTTVGGKTPANPIYLATGTEVSFTVTVNASAGNATGSVNVSVDGGTATAYPLTAGSGTTSTASVSLSGLIAGTHNISASYPTTGSYTGSTNSSATSFSIAQATTTVTWSPAATSGPYSQSIGTGVFNASATSGSTSVPGTFVYTATPSGGSATAVDSATYLAIGSYSFNVTFTPTDSVDYTGNTASVASFTVTKANTTAAVGASTTVVAADGSGNYTTVQAAVNALAATGGAIYIAPGTYTGQISIAYPNVALHGLGGNPSNVLLTAEAGALSATSGVGQNTNPFGFSGDEGSATLVVAKSTVNSVSYTPSNFFLENLSIQNTYDTDTTNTNALVGSNSNCTSVSSSSNNTLFNNGTLCGSQALAVWITADKTVFNNVRLLSLQDTLYNGTGSTSCSPCTSTRQYFWKNYITGDIDYVFGDAAAVFDQTTFYTQYHNGSNTGNATVFAQNKSVVNGGPGDYLSGYVANNSIFTSQSTPSGAMTSLNYGRPYGKYSTVVLLNNSVDDVVAAGWEEFSGQTNLPTSYFYEYGTTGAGAATLAQRETTSVQPSVVSAAFAARYAPITFLATAAPDVWNPLTALATGVNAYVPSGSSASIAYGSSITLLARPQTPGGGAIPTGNFTLTDNGGALASGSLDASGAMYYTSKTLAGGTHNLVFTYAGDANFNGSTSSAFVLTVNTVATTTTFSVTTPAPTYGSAVALTATVSPNTGSVTPTGSVALTVDSNSPITANLVNGVASFSLTGLSAGSHTLSGVYSGDPGDATSTGTGSVSLAKAPLTVTGSSFSRAYQAANPALTYAISGTFYGSDTAANATSGSATVSTTAVRNSPAGAYPVNVVAGTLTSTNYSFTYVAGTATVNGGVAQTIVFPFIPNIPHGLTVPLFGRALSGLAVTYSVSGPASIVNGNQLSVTGTGTVTITANQSGNSTFSAATPVSRSFTAQ